LVVKRTLTEEVLLLDFVPKVKAVEEEA